MLKPEFWLALVSVDNIGPRRVKLLLSRFGTIENIFSADIADIASLPKFNPLLAKNILKAGKKFDKFRKHFEFLKDKGIELICLNDKNYPKLLKRIPDSPPILCKKGLMDIFPDKAIAIVGTRTPSEQGILSAIEVSAEFASAGFTIVSGLAKGIDTAAHFGALEANGKTIAVLGCSLWKIYPKENKGVANCICSNGMLLSEQPFPAKPTSANLVSRNRIISGTSICVIVIEAEPNSGAMRTIEFAQKQGRQCYFYKGSQRKKYLVAKGVNNISLSELPILIDSLKKQEVVDNFKKDQIELF